MPAVIGAEQAPLLTQDEGVHDRGRGALDALIVHEEDVAEVCLAQAVSGLVQRNCLDIEVSCTVVSPVETRIVLDFSKRSIKLAIVVYISEVS